MIALNAPPRVLIYLGEVGTMHVWFVSERNVRGVHITAEVGEFLCLPGDSCGCDGSKWWDLLGSIDGNRWEWNGSGNPTECNGRRVTRIVAFL